MSGSGKLTDPACIEENNVMFSLQAKRAIYLMKTLFHLNCKLYNTLMPSHIHVVNISIKIVQEYECFKDKFYRHFLATTFFHLASENNFSDLLVPA